VHSRYIRTLSDLPVAGRRVVVTVRVRRFRCVGEMCRTKVFAEWLEPGLAAAYARRTGRLKTIVHHLGLALGGRPAESFARRLMVPACRDTMLRTVRRRARRPIKAAVPALDEARSLLSGFQAMIRERRPLDLDTWIDTAAHGLLASFANGLSRDRAAVAAALAEPWSYGQTEGQNTRLKLVKRQMFGRANLNLLEARLIGAG